jgi:signal transduction histidine kinase
MNGILGFTELLQEPQLVKQQKYIKIIEKSKRMLNIINYYQYSKVESGQIEVLKLKLILMTYYNTYFNSLQMKQNEREFSLIKEKLHANENLLKPIKKNYMLH